MTCKEDLNTEKRATRTRWNRREKTLDRAMTNIAALCGDVQGIAGRSLQTTCCRPALDSTRALPEAVEAGEESQDDALLRGILFDLLPSDGATVTNASLFESFASRALAQHHVHVAADDYERCMEALLAQGHVRRGKGRGGSVGRVIDAAAE